MVLKMRMADGTAAAKCLIALGSKHLRSLKERG
jgi:hypothetical protein